MGHESYVRHDIVREPSNRAFGLLFAAVFAIIGLLPLLHGGNVHVWAITIGGIFLLAAFAFPSVLKPLNRTWLQLGLLLHKIVSPIVLGVMFFLVVTPVGLLMRALHRNPLQLKMDKHAKSYWVERIPPGPTAESLKDQF